MEERNAAESNEDRRRYRGLAAGLHKRIRLVAPIRRCVIDCLRLQPGEQVLDMGCGTAHRLGSACGGNMVRMGVLAGIGGPDCRDVSVWMSLGVYRAGAHEPSMDRHGRSPLRDCCDCLCHGPQVRAMRE